MDLPSELEPGQRLRDLSYQIKTSSEESAHSQRYCITDRTVVAREEITTTAGTFDCYKISYVTTVKGRKAKGPYLTNTWYAPGVGLVRGEQYNEKGQLAELQLLKRIESSLAENSSKE